MYFLFYSFVLLLIDLKIPLTHSGGAKEPKTWRKNTKNKNDCFSSLPITVY